MIDLSKEFFLIFLENMISQDASRIPQKEIQQTTCIVWRARGDLNPRPQAFSA